MTGATVYERFHCHAESYLVWILDIATTYIFISKELLLYPGQATLAYFLPVALGYSNRLN